MAMGQEDSSDTPPTSWLQRFSRRVTSAPAVPLPRSIALKTSISEFLLVTRLRAQNLLRRHGAHTAAQGKSDADGLAGADAAAAEQAAMMARFAHILGVTCKHWFADEPPSVRSHRPKL